MYLKFINYRADLFDPTKVISSSEFFDKKKNFTPDGLFSEEIFGENGDDKAADVLGWIDFGDIQIISPALFPRLSKVLKPSVLNKIISYNKKTDEKGDLFDDTKGKEIEYQNIGIPKFIEHFEDIMKVHARDDIPEYETIMKAYEEGKLFINCMPVFSSKLRPGVLFSGNAESKPSFKYDDINNYYNIAIKYSNEIKNVTSDKESEIYKLIVYPLIYGLQEYCNKIINFIINNFLKGKKGFLRAQIASTRVDYSARNVITPSNLSELDGVELPYLTFLEIYRFLLINLIVRTEGISFNEADAYIQKCKNGFDKKLYKYMNMLIEKGNLKIILNRNPSINIGSMFLLNVVKVKCDFTDLTLSLSNMILALLNADYDGDVLNIIGLLTTSEKSYFANLAPSNLIIDKNNGKFNRGFMIAKDTKCGYHILNNT